MFPSKTLLYVVFMALSAVDASPLSRRSGKNGLSFLAKLHDRSSLSIVEKDRARAKAMKQAGHLGKRSPAISATNTGTYYTTQIAIGDSTNYSNYTVLVDTGSSSTFVGAGSQKYTPTSTSTDTGNTVLVTYGTGSFTGKEWIDTVTLSPDLVITQQSIGVASTSTGFSGVDGILGVGPIDLTAGTVSNTNTVPTVVDNLVSQGTIAENVLGVYFVPISITDAIAEGELTFGGYDSSLITNSMNYAPVTTTWPAAAYWGVDQSITYGTTTVLASTAGIVDTGTTLILISSDAFEAYQSLIGATLDSATRLLTIDATQYASLQSLWFNIGSNSYELTPDAQTWPRSLNTAIGGSSDSIYLIIADNKNPSGSGLDFTLGYCFLQRYYSVYDATNSQVGFASTFFTQSILNQ